MSGTGGVFAPHTVNDFNLNSGTATSNIRGIANNCKFGAPNVFTAKSAWSGTANIGFEKYNQTAGDHRTEMTYGQLRTDATVYNTAAPSMKMTPNSATSKLESAPLGRGIQAAVNSGNTITATVYLRKDATYFGNQPRLIVRANPAVGINADTVLATDTTTKTATGYTTWNPSDISAFVTLSNANLTFNGSNSGSGGCRAAIPVTTGNKAYWEYTLNTISSGVVGIATPTAFLTVFSNSTAAAIVQSVGSIFINNTSSGSSLGSLPNGSIVGVAVDLSANLIWFRKAPSGNWNGSGTANPATGTGGISLSPLTGSLFPIVSMSAGTEQVTANFGASAFNGTVPSGFTSGVTLPVYPGTWVQLSGTTIAATDDGAMEFIVDCDGTAGFINLDDWSFA